jgi:hypothetical protein
VSFAVLNFSVKVVDLSPVLRTSLDIYRESATELNGACFLLNTPEPSAEEGNSVTMFRFLTLEIDH